MTSSIGRSDGAAAPDLLIADGQDAAETPPVEGVEGRAEPTDGFEEPDSSPIDPVVEAPVRPIEPTQTSSAAPDAALLNVLDESELESYRALRDSASFAALDPSLQSAVRRELTRRPGALEDLVDWTSNAEFQAAEGDEQADLYQLFATAGLRSVGTGVAASNLGAEPARLAVVFPGQRAHKGGGELAEVMRRATQMQRMFPKAAIDVVVFDPPETINDGHPGTGPRFNRVTSYMSERLGWDGPWDYESQPVVERDGLRFIYATAPADEAGNPRPDFEEAYTVRYPRGGAEFEDVRGRDNDTLWRDRSRLASGMWPSSDSLGAAVVNRADLVIAAGAAHSTDVRAWRLDPAPRSHWTLEFRLVRGRHHGGGRAGPGTRNLPFASGRSDVRRAHQ